MSDKWNTRADVAFSPTEDPTRVSEDSSHQGAPPARGNNVVFIAIDPEKFAGLEALTEHQLSLGGEQSGHIIFTTHATTGDGILTGLQLAAELKRTGKTLAELASVMTVYPQVLVNVRLKPGQDWKVNTAMTRATQAVEAELGARGRVLIRASGTEPLVRVMVEARDAAQARACAQRIADCLKD